LIRMFTSPYSGASSALSHKYILPEGVSYSNIRVYLAGYTSQGGGCYTVHESQNFGGLEHYTSLSAAIYGHPGGGGVSTTM
jgi:hypothetical protein